MRDVFFECDGGVGEVGRAVAVRDGPDGDCEARWGAFFDGAKVEGGVGGGGVEGGGKGGGGEEGEDEGGV